MNKMKIYLSALVLLPFLLAGCGNNTKITADITDFGIYVGGIPKSIVEAPTTALGQVTSHSGSVLAEKTTRVPARIGVAFGFTYFLKGEPEGTSIPLRYAWESPGITAPGKNVVFQEEFPWTSKIGSYGRHLFRFEQEWELIPGVWKLQIYHGEQVLAEQSFTVYDVDE